MPNIVLHFDCQGQDKEFNLKLPKSWSEKPVSTTVAFAIENYNKKNGTSLSADAGYLCLGADALHPEGIFSELVPNKSDLFLKIGTLPKDTLKEVKKEEVKLAVNDASLLNCTNFACQQKFREAENYDTACTYHEKPPVFHETAKYWSCCPDKKGYDWDEFMKIPGCQAGRHTAVKKVGLGFLGGGDIRAAAKGQAATEAPAETASPAPTPAPPTEAAAPAKRAKPTPEAPTPTKQVKPTTASTSAVSDRFIAARAGLIELGVDGRAFDVARAQITQESGSDEQAADRLAALITDALNFAASNQSAKPKKSGKRSSAKSKQAQE